MARQMCKRCNGIFEVGIKGYCDKCNARNEKDFQAILDYLDKNPDAIVLEIIDKTGVTLRTLNRFVAEGGISYKESNIRLADIETGEYLNIINRLVASRGKFHSDI